MDCCDYEPNPDGVAIDLFVTKTRTNTLKFSDSCSNPAFSLHRLPRSDFQSPPFFKRLLSDSSANPLIFISHNQKAIWEGFRNDSSDPMFRVERTINTLARLEFEVFLKTGDNKCDFKMRGSPFFRSCTIYKGDSIVAQDLYLFLML